MSFPIACPHCGTRGSAPTGSGGKIFPCPKCGKQFMVPPESHSEEVVEEIVVPEVVSTGEKDCPFCGEAVKTVARRCKHCGETLDVALRATEESERRARQSNKPAPKSRRRPRNDDDDDEYDRPRSRGRDREVHQTVVVNNRSGRGFPHFMHLLLTFCTCGFWFPIWIICYLCSSD